VAAPRKTDKTAEALRERALEYPETEEHFPWGERAIKVKGKVFLFLRADKTGLGLSLKLPLSGPDALREDFAEPTGYGLGKSGWVSFRFAPTVTPPTARLLAWLDESFRAVAPKTLVASLLPAKAPPPKRAAAKKAPAKKAPRR
jgi:predicted DNA-binding protein (MmcQ/YjbR family)